jgi:hypothetical protein
VAKRATGLNVAVATTRGNLFARSGAADPCGEDLGEIVRIRERTSDHERFSSSDI